MKGSMFLASAIIAPTVCSATGTVPNAGLLTTAMPRAVAAAMSIASVPRPEVEMIRRCGAAASAAPGSLLG
ncbi:hypothetical protein D3C83_240740 [compost metagenome]